jgi:hypothetical protein
VKVNVVWLFYAALIVLNYMTCFAPDSSILLDVFARSLPRVAAEDEEEPMGCPVEVEKTLHYLHDLLETLQLWEKATKAEELSETQFAVYCNTELTHLDELGD